MCGDIGATNLRFALLNKKGEVLNKAKAKTPEKKEAIIKKVVNLIKKTSDNPSLIALGVGGIVDFARGSVVYTPNFDFSDVPLQRIVQKEFNLPTIVDNDANMAAWGEKIYGSATKAKNFVCVTLGTGIGGGLVINGKLYRGAYYAAGEIGHTTIGYSSLIKAFGRKADYENMASGKALGRLARNMIKPGSKSLVLKLAKGKVKEINGKTVTLAARKGDETAIKILSRFTDIIGIGLANIVDIVDPELIVINGGLSDECKLIIPGIEKSLNKRIFAVKYRKPKIMAGKLGSDAGIFGAAAMAFYPNG